MGPSSPGADVFVAWIAAGAALAGALVGGAASFLGSWWATHRQVRWSREQLVREKLEALAEAASAVEHQYNVFAGDLLRAVMKGRLDLTSQAPVPVDRLRMLAAFYAPELAGDLAEIVRLQEVFVLLAAGVSAPVAAEDQEHLRVEIAGAMVGMAGLCRGIVARAANLAREQLGL